MILALKNHKIIRYIFICRFGKVMVRFKLDKETKLKRETSIHTQIDTVVSDCESCFCSLLTASSCAYYYFIPVSVPSPAN